jgi:hypothetical protein
MIMDKTIKRVTGYESRKPRIMIYVYNIYMGTE